MLFNSTIYIKAQTVDDSGVFNSPINNRAVIYASIFFNNDGTPGNYDASFVLSQSAISTWNDYSAAIAFYSTRIEVRNGNSITGTNTATSVSVK